MPEYNVIVKFENPEMTTKLSQVVADSKVEAEVEAIRDAITKYPEGKKFEATAEEIEV